ncbi:hypothetical protein B296_00047485 [Ensete ventricosum]|uniref:Uncharacterized protein n=1 Tax=Ensete ventricosum TaxID=4639 RepID=A0A426YZ81_ENSVE|nr:hypothetical protein B296_00047485 [Ensete ventricosum]
MLERVKATENQEEPLLEVGDPQCPLRFITEAIEEDEAHPQQAVASTTPLEIIVSGDETPSQSHSTTRSVKRHGSEVDSSALTNNGNEAGESMVPSTQFEGSAWTGEQYSTHATKDSDHGLDEVPVKYARKGKGKLVNDF